MTDAYDTVTEGLAIHIERNGPMNDPEEIVKAIQAMGLKIVGAEEILRLLMVEMTRLHSMETLQAAQEFIIDKYMFESNPPRTLQTILLCNSVVKEVIEDKLYERRKAECAQTDQLGSFSKNGGNTFN